MAWEEARYRIWHLRVRTRMAEERADRAIGVLRACRFTDSCPPLKLSKTNISPSNTTAVAVLPTTPPQFNVPIYETPLPRQIATSDVQRHSVLCGSS
ncbi:hypothetical protein ARMGADRAFT_353020 [Armillaria gallica]|uniref:Uncharacterized protein n=1 Tax=Armillaria gallica TaxID=47427 RepID=A0A2H3D065_ARMGA|nr:hypothetical protein ARMGADRAFT_353020 [Armillaria gallica]